MVCSRCGGKTRVIDNSNTDEENYRTRRCMKCKSEFFTFLYFLARMEEME